DDGRFWRVVVDMRMRVGVRSTIGIGPVRGGRSVNEDNYLVAHGAVARFLGAGGERTVDATGPGLMVAVADGMGGHDHGSLASGAAVQALARLFRDGLPADPELALHRFVLRAHRRLRERARARGAANMGTTLTVVWLIADCAHWVHVGDSRLWLERGGSLQQLSRDHTRGEFASRDGRTEPVEADALTQNFLFGSRGLGDDESIRVDAGTDTGSVPLLPGDRLLLTSDGVHGFVAPHRIAEVLLAGSTPDEAVRRVVDASLAAGSDDNITALVVSIDAVTALDHGGSLPDG
ncbi:MAG: protein phosphatase 2C domain-containing protein, partial [Myxococcota bacterium]|nr:protein phosphatase 2C domain-containing protein [Myxococcota bacterium]